MKLCNLTVAYEVHKRFTCLASYIKSYSEIWLHNRLAYSGEDSHAVFLGLGISFHAVHRDTTVVIHRFPEVTSDTFRWPLNLRGLIKYL